MPLSIASSISTPQGRGTQWRTRLFIIVAVPRGRDFRYLSIQIVSFVRTGSIVRLDTATGGGGGGRGERSRGATRLTDSQ